MEYTVLPCSESDGEYIDEKLIEYNLSRVPAKQDDLFRPVSLKIEDVQGNIVAGCLAVIYCWNILAVEIVWVDEAHRGKGLGSRLLREAEDRARGLGCRLVHLDTFDFQAREFYEKNGYTVFGTLEDCPEGHCRYYMSKKL